MKKALAILIFLSLFTQCFMQLGIIAYYELNKNYIAQHLCENRDKPQLKCCGKCYLHKQLKKADESGNPQNVPDKLTKAEIINFIIPDTWKISVSGSENILSIKNPRSQNLFDIVTARSVFHPPAFFC